MKTVRFSLVPHNCASLFICLVEGIFKNGASEWFPSWQSSKKKIAANANALNLRWGGFRIQTLNNCLETLLVPPRQLGLTLPWIDWTFQRSQTMPERISLSFNLIQKCHAKTFYVCLGNSRGRKQWNDCCQVDTMLWEYFVRFRV